MDIPVLPLLARSECVTLEAMLALLLLDHILGHRFVHVFEEIFFGQADHNWSFGGDLANLARPSAHIGARWNRIDRDADYEDVSMRVLHLPVLTQVLVATRVVNLNVDLLSPDVLDSVVDVEHGGLVLFREVVLEVVANQAGFADGRIANQHDFDRFRPICWDLSAISSYPRNCFTRIRCGCPCVLIALMKVLAVITSFI